MTINFYINVDNRNSAAEYNIICYIREKGSTATLNTGVKVQAKYWDKKKQIIKRNYTGSVEKNKYLSNYKSSLETKIFELKAQNPTVINFYLYITYTQINLYM